MTRTHFILLTAFVAALPAAAAAGSFFSSNSKPCFAAGAVGYRLTGERRADFTVKFDNAAAQPDLTVAMVDDPAVADFVLVDDADDAASCKGTSVIRTIRVDPEAHDPDLTVALPADASQARFKIFARSAEFTAQDAAALFAVLFKSTKRRDLAARP